MRHRTFELLDESGTVVSGERAELTERERRLVDGAATFHTTALPGRTLRLTVLRSPPGTLPRLTDEDRRRVGWEDDREVAAAVVVRSTRPAEAGPSAPGAVLDLVIDLGGTAGTASSTIVAPGLRGFLRRKARTQVPVHFDALRQLRTDLLESRYRTGAVPRKIATRLERGAGTHDPGAPPAVLFGMHWLELGGAERWALRAVELAREAGLTPIVITDKPSTHPWITRSELDGAIVVPLTQPIDPELEAAFLSGVLAAFDVRGIHLHHCSWLYDRLPWIRALRPDIPVVDSLHIVEWRTGGFVDISVRLSDLIDVHHVVSPQLRDHLIGRHGVEPAKVALATLGDLTVGDIAPTVGWTNGSAGRPFTVAFVGRYTQQKRPYLFVKLASRLSTVAPVPMRFVMHGDGELAGEVRSLRLRLGVAELLELRGTDHAVADTLAEADALVVPSDNEGLTLTSFEATRAGVPVISTDVGSQASLVADGLLCPRHPYPFLRAAAERVLAMVESDQQRKIWLDEQHAKADRFATLPDADSWTRDLYEGWRP